MYSFKKLILGLLLASAILLFSHISNSQTARMRDGFYLGPINYFWITEMQTPAQMNNYSSVTLILN